MKTALRIWQLGWSLLALPFAYIVILFALFAGGPRKAREWAHEQGLWFF